MHIRRKTWAIIKNWTKMNSPTVTNSLLILTHEKETNSKEEKKMDHQW